MPPILDRLIHQLKAKGHNDEAAHSIAVAALQRSGNLKRGTEEATPKGIKRGKMSPGQRAIDRATKRSGRKASEYSYNARTNRATLKRRRGK
jgi:hypothetical protein